MAHSHGSEISIFSLSSNPSLAKEIADTVGVKLGDLSLTRFKDGEINVDINQTVRGHDVFLVQTTSSPVNDHYFELFIVCDALKRASAKTINIIMPYYGYSRQDRNVGFRKPISAKLIADLLTTAGASRLFCLDLHAAQIQGFFDIPIDNFSALPVMVSYVKKLKLDNMIIVSPDHGGASRARSFANFFGEAPIAIADKRRPQPNVAEIMSVIGDVKGKNCVIVDDMIDTAGSACAAAEALMREGAKSVYMCASHALLSGDAVKKIEESCIKKLIVTNSVALPPEKRSEKIVQLSVGKIFGHGIINMLEKKPLSELFTYNENTEDLLS